MRLPCDEGCWRGPEFASDRGHKADPESTACALDVARGRNDGGSVFCATVGLVNLRRELRRSCNGSELCRRCFWRGCVSARTCKPSTLAWSLAGCHRCRTGILGQELRAYPLHRITRSLAGHTNQSARTSLAIELFTRFGGVPPWKPHLKAGV